MTVEDWARAEAEKRYPAIRTSGNLAWPDSFRDVYAAGLTDLAERMLSDEAIEAHIEAQKRHDLEYHYDSGLVLGCSCGKGRTPVFRNNNAAYQHVARAAIEAALAVATHTPNSGDD